MVQLGVRFDSRTVEPEKPIEPVPNGDYLVMIVDSDLRETKAGDGQFLELTLQVIDGPFKNRKLWDRLNIRNPNPDAVDMAWARFSAICRAIDVPLCEDSAQLHNRPMMAKVVRKNRKDTGEPTNEVKGYFAIGAVPPSSGTPTMPAYANAAPHGAPPAYRPPAGPSHSHSHPHQSQHNGSPAQQAFQATSAPPRAPQHQPQQHYAPPVQQQQYQQQQQQAPATQHQAPPRFQPQPQPQQPRPSTGPAAAGIPEEDIPFEVEFPAPPYQRNA